MCGIVGYVGKEDCLPILINGLKKLEYRGYDSAGVAFTSENGLRVIKAQGKLKNLKKKLSPLISHPRLPTLTAGKASGQVSPLGIGHTRWATHGEPSEDNAHPHVCCASNIALVHNGILENYQELKQQLIKKNHRFTSQTDTEVLAHLIEESVKNGADFAEAVAASLDKVKGSFAIVVINQKDPNTIIAARKDSPLIIGLGKKGNYVASDIPAILDKTKKIQVLEDDDLAIVKADSVKLVKNGRAVKRKIINVDWDLEASEKSGYEDFMLKEIFEQGKAIKETLRAYIKNDSVNLRTLETSEKELKEITRLFIIACGTSFHAALIGKLAIEEWAKIPVEVEISSEFRYRFPVIQTGTFLVAITQSGETADTLAGVREALKRGHETVAVTNVLGSTITRETSGSLLTQAGPEIGVAATKTFTTQLVALYLLALKLAKVKGTLADADAQMIKNELLRLPEITEKTLKNTQQIKEIAQKYYDKPDFLFLGRGYGLPVALEGALKLKEISYIHAEGCAAGEMKHGPIALIDKDCPVVAIANRSSTYSKVCSNIEEVKARGADIIGVISEGDSDLKGQLKNFIEVPAIIEAIAPVTTIIPLQLFAYYIAKAKGLDVDQPRNLAKSVTVE